MNFKPDDCVIFYIFFMCLVVCLTGTVQNLLAVVFFTFTSVISLSENKHYSIKNGCKMIHNHGKTTSVTTKMFFF